MKIFLKILLGLVIFIALGWVLVSFYMNTVLKNQMAETLIMSSFSVQGQGSTMTIFTDKTFTADMHPLGEVKTCNKGIISEVDYNTFVSYIRSTNFMTKKLYQFDDVSMVCDSFSRLTVSIDGKTKNISSPCVGEYSADTKEILKTKEEIHKKLEEVIKKSPQTSCATSASTQN